MDDQNHGTTKIDKTHMDSVWKRSSLNPDAKKPEQVESDIYQQIQKCISLLASEEGEKKGSLRSKNNKEGGSNETQIVEK